MGSSSTPHGPLPPLPPAFTPEEVLSRRGETIVLRARREGSPFLLRLEPGSGREARAELAVLAALDHPALAVARDHGSLPDGGWYSARPWIEGADLGTWSAARGPEEIAEAVARLTSPLAHLHRAGYVHGDLKPENVLVTESGDVVLCDLGLSRAADGGAEESGVSGTLQAIAPELLLGLPATPASDVFSLGALLAHLLVGRRRSAREFYAAFPRRSFLDASGIAPEDLPRWARDLVVPMTAREPERRPACALEIGRTLAVRLGFMLPEAAAEPVLRWRAIQGREEWARGWVRGFAADESPMRQWLQLPTREDPRALWEDLRLRLTLAGHPQQGVDLDAAHVDRITAGFDRWIGETAHGERCLLVLLDTPGPTARRIVEVLANELRRNDAERPSTLIVVGTGEEAPPGPGWVVHTVPPVEMETVQRILAPQLPEVPAADVARLAQLLTEGTEGAATLLDRRLRRAQREGVLSWDGAAMRLRTGALERLREVETSPAGDGDASLPTPAAVVTTAIAVAGGRVTISELAALSELPLARFGAVLHELEEAGIVRHERHAGELAVHACAGVAPGFPDAAQARILHGRLAELRRESGAEPHHYLPHLVCADPTPQSVHRLREALTALREGGQGELALEVAERSVAFARRLGIDVNADLPELLSEVAGTWCHLGQPDQALRVLEELPSDPRGEALRRLGHARIARLRNRPEEALALYEEVATLDPASRVEAERQRAALLYTLGRDEEVVALVEGLLDAGAGLPPRRWVHVRSLAAMSAFRLGRIEESRAALRELLTEALAIGEPVLVIALRIDVATLERRAGSIARAREELEEALALAEQHGLSGPLAQVRETLGSVLRDEGAMTRAAELLRQALASRERFGDRDGAARVRGVLALLLCDRGHGPAARQVIDESLAHLGPAWKRRYGPLLRAKRAEIGARMERDEAAEEPLSLEEEADPRILLAMARTAWMRGRRADARGYAERAEGLARSLRQARPVAEARLLVRWIDGDLDATAHDETSRLLEDDIACLAVLRETGHGFDTDATAALASRLEAAGRDDRAARLHLALAGRATDDVRAREHRERAEALLAACAAGATAEETSALRRHLLGIPDPWPGDLLEAHRRDEAHGFLDADVSALLEINRRLLAQQDSRGLLGAIVESAVQVAGAERGFFVLEEHGLLRFDIALDSSRGGIDSPELEVSRSIVTEALQRMEPIRVSNAADDEILGHASSVVSLELRSVLCVPIEITPDLRGAIYVDHRLRTGAFDPHAERLCTVLASQAALAIHQVRRLEEIRDLNRRLEQRVRDRDSDLRSARLALAEARIEQAPSHLVGASPTMRRIRNVLQRCATSNLTVLVVGDSGTGKELAARSLHDLSERKDNPFVSENCAALPASLIESELFGYVKGAFTGADRDRRGLIEQADGGTLFLDEIGELPLDLQAKLLRVLETSEIRPVGADETRRVDFRLVAATNRDLEREAREGTFRSDLFYRLDGLRVAMPSLAEHPEDIPELVEHFLRDEERRGQPRRRITARVLQRLTARAWPGNVRELRNEIARLCVLSEGDLDDPDLLRPSTAAAPLATSEGGDLLPLAELERRAILAALERTHGDKRKAASLLGISRAKIYQRLKEWRESERNETEPETAVAAGGRVASPEPGA